MVAGPADQIMKASAFAAEDDHAVAGQIELIVVGCTTLVETDDPEILTLELFERPHQVDYARDAKVLSSTGAGLDGYGTQGRRSPLRQHHTVDSGAVGYAQESAQVLWVFDAIEGEEQTRLTCVRWGLRE
jgi:hypothetical protein